MVNDDGWNAPGITAAYDALVAAGHHVTLVAPLVNQSGRSMATSDASLAVTRPAGEEPKYAVDGTPVDSLNIGLQGILADDPPDVVVSGVNTGANVAGNTNYSGTVGAAAAAAQQGVPALAVSADVGGADGTGNYKDAAKIVVELVDSLARTNFDGLGTEGFLNVNVPFETASREAPKGVRVVPLAKEAPRTVKYDESSPGTWTPVFAYDARVGGSGSDAERLADGWTTVTFLPVERTPVAREQKRLSELLDE
nr:5'/3'-nucleotidase SurE [Aeromicrobium sp. CFBP 8757]